MDGRSLSDAGGWATSPLHRLHRSIASNSYCRITTTRGAALLALFEKCEPQLSVPSQFELPTLRHAGILVPDSTVAPTVPKNPANSSFPPSCRFLPRTSKCTGMIFASTCQRLIGHMMFRSVNEMKMSRHRSAKGARWAAIRCSMQRRSRVQHSCKPWWSMIPPSIAN